MFMEELACICSGHLLPCGGGGRLRSLRLRLSDNNLRNLHATMHHIPLVLKNLPSLVALEIELETPDGRSYICCACPAHPLMMTNPVWSMTGSAVCRTV